MTGSKNGSLVAGLTVLAAGLGHAYLGRWRRGAIWFGLYLLTLVLFVAYTPMLAGGETSSPFLMRILEGDLDPMGAAFPLSILALCLVDLYVLLRFGDATEGGHVDDA